MPEPEIAANAWNGLVELLCPNCGSVITGFGPESVACGKCGRHWPIVDGIVSLADESTFYYGEIDQDTMRRLNSDVRAYGRPAAFERMYPTLGYLKDWIVDYALNELRFPWVSLLGVGPGDTVLDIGAGWGNASLHFARRGCKVISMDLTIERLRFVQSRYQEEGLTNANVLHAGNAEAMPFPDDTFSAVVMNGVLEWFPESHEGNPDRIQLNALAEARRILKPGGVLVIGIENRHSWRYFRGDPDDHTGLRYGALLPRPIANWYSLRVRRKPYRTYTHSWRTYRRMLAKTGFAQQEFLCPLPDYRECKHIVDLSDPIACLAAIDALLPVSRKARTALHLVQRIAGLGTVVPSFLIFASDTSDNRRAS